MATTMKRETLKSIGNVPDWVLKQQRSKDKDQGTKPVAKPVKAKPTKAKLPSYAVPSPSLPSLPSLHAVPAVPSAGPVAKPVIKEQVKEPQEKGTQPPSAGSKVRRIYSREFLIKFRYSVAPFPPGVETPADIIEQYNKDFQLRERSAETPALTAKPAAPTSAPVSTSAPLPATAAAEPAESRPEKRLKKKREGEAPSTSAAAAEKKTFKLRLGTTDESILRSPLFRASAKTPVHTAPVASAAKVVVNEDKENPAGSIKPARAASVTKTRSVSPAVKREAAPKTSKLPTTPASTVPAPVVPAAAPVQAPVVAPVMAPAPEFIPIAVAVPAPASDVAMEDADKDEVLDALTKKLKGVMKETDARRLAQRQKQIEYGKATLGYKDYCQQIAKSKRKREDPKTPNKYQVCSKRSWDGQIRKWRRMLHFYDPLELKEAQARGETFEMEKVEITDADLLAEENALLD